MKDDDRIEREGFFVVGLAIGGIVMTLVTSILNYFFG